MEYGKEYKHMTHKNVDTSVQWIHVKIFDSSDTGGNAHFGWTNFSTVWITDSEDYPGNLQ